MNGSATRMRRSGFTLLEVLVVVTILVILMGIVVGAGVGLVSNRRAAVTESVLLTLDRAMEEYIGAQGAPPPWDSVGYIETPGLDLVSDDGENSPTISNGVPPIVDGPSLAFPEYPQNGGVYYPRFPDAAAFVRQAQGFGAVDEIFVGLEQWLYPTISTGRRGDYHDGVRADDTTPSIRDGWATEDWIGDRNSADWPLLIEGGSRLILYVHPGNQLAQGLYGRCDSGRPYFMSAGPDGVYGSTNEIPATQGLDGNRNDSDAGILGALKGLEDNLYSYRVGAALGTSGEDDDKVADQFNRQYR